MTIRSVNLDGQSDKIRQDIIAEGGNFSKFVREALVMWNSATGNIPCLFEDGEREIKCFPRTDRLCGQCWPDGAPLRQDWLKYQGQEMTGAGLYPRHYREEVDGKYQDITGNHEWISKQARDLNADWVKIQRVDWTTLDTHGRLVVQSRGERPTFRERFRLARHIFIGRCSVDELTGLVRRP